MWVFEEFGSLVVVKFFFIFIVVGVVVVWKEFEVGVEEVFVIGDVKVSYYLVVFFYVFYVWFDFFYDIYEFVFYDVVCLYFGYGVNVDV